MTDLRKLAEGESCTIKSKICSGRVDETVLAHYRMKIDGKAMKPDDLRAAKACFPCHDAADGRRQGIPRDEIRRLHAIGVFATLHKLAEDGVMSLQQMEHIIKHVETVSDIPELPKYLPRTGF